MVFACCQCVTVYKQFGCVYIFPLLKLIIVPQFINGVTDIKFVSQSKNGVPDIKFLSQSINGVPDMKFVSVYKWVANGFSLP